ncbi:hypothetical protein [Pseudoalteromonas sp. S558]|uniref:hypothetical protein n=1 Tax=Pseudoalteromonas sp. S558 TaxID=2066515 RepID=UPI00110B1847|nr:hypothetical protein [Pseudoalteromonas sp. S558]TMN98277.1 hypothetical protein CWB66_16655 [Pseudoalteromonas sp. S558]
MFLEKKADIENFINMYDVKLFEFKFQLDSDNSEQVLLIFKDSLKILNSIIQSPEKWSQYCPTAILKQGSEFIQQIKTLSNDTNEKLSQAEVESIYSYCIDFLFEANFRAEKENFIEGKLFKDLERNVFLNINNPILSSYTRTGIAYALYATPHNLLKDLFHSENIKLFSEVDKKTEKANLAVNKLNTFSSEVTDAISELQSELNKKEQTVKNLNETLDKQKTAFNFVGLYDGFNQLLRTKIKESRVLLGLLAVMGCMMIIPLLCTIFGWLPESILKAEEPISHLLKLVPFISLEILLIYFFRVILQNYKSVKGQILQIELRQTLCQFIQNYADYSKEIKKDDPTVLEKFENLIFSGIISDAENLPSTFDGMDQIGKLFSTLKGKG